MGGLLPVLLVVPGLHLADGRHHGLGDDAHQEGPPRAGELDDLTYKYRDTISTLFYIDFHHGPRTAQKDRSRKDPQRTHLVNQANLRNTVEQLENALVQYRKDAKNKEEGTGKIMLADLKRLLKTAELDTQKLIQRHNEAVAENNKLKGTVNTARNERIVHSGIFKNLEKEIRLY